MSRRLDFADWLQRRGRADRAQWIRDSCGACDLDSPIESLHTRTETAASFCANHTFYDHLDMLWQRIRPEWWPRGNDEQPQGGVNCQSVFGRVLIHASMQAPSRVFEGAWLRRAHEEGWLELVQFEPDDEAALASLMQIPDDQQNLPFLLNTSRTRCERPPNKQVEALLCFPGLRGIVFHTSELGLPSVRRFSEAATHLQFLSLLGLRSNSRLFALEQLGNLPWLRSLRVSSAHPDDASIDYILKATQLRSLTIQSTRLTNSGLLKISEMNDLQFLSLDAPRISRAAIQEFRELRPELKLRVSGDLRMAIGPA